MISERLSRRDDANHAITRSYSVAGPATVQPRWTHSLGSRTNSAGLATKMKGRRRGGSREETAAAHHFEPKAVTANYQPHNERETAFGELGAPAPSDVVYGQLSSFRVRV